MNRKVMLFLVLALSVLSIMAVGIWGSLPDPSDSVTLVSIAFEDSRIDSTTGTKILYVQDIVTDFDTHNQVSIAFACSPGDANVNLVVYSDETTVGAVLLEGYVLVTFSEKTPVTITIRDKKTEKTDSVTLLFQPPGEIEVPDDIL